MYLYFSEYFVEMYNTKYEVLLSNNIKKVHFLIQYKRIKNNYGFVKY